MRLNFKRSRKKGQYFPCQTCGEMQYRRPHKAKQILAGKRRVFCKLCYTKHIRQIAPPHEFPRPLEIPVPKSKQRKGRKHAYIRREEQAHEEQTEMRKRMQAFEDSIAKLEIDGHQESADAIRKIVVTRYGLHGGVLDEDRIARLKETWA